jgi:hypothetical protein
LPTQLKPAHAEQTLPQKAVPQVWPSLHVQLNVFVGLHGSGTGPQFTTAFALEIPNSTNRVTTVSLFISTSQCWRLFDCGGSHLANAMLAAEREGQPPEPAVADVLFVSEPTGWQRLAKRFSWLAGTGSVMG